MASISGGITWRVTGAYVPTNSSKTGLVAETRDFLLAYDQTGDIEQTARQLKDGGLPQRSRETRSVIVTMIKRRLVSWQPPAWVLANLVGFAHDSSPEALQAALLMHVCRQDALLYDTVQQVILPQWRSGELQVRIADVQRLLDHAEPTHPEIAGWSHETRTKLAGNILSILRDYGLLQGAARVAYKRIVEPVVPPAVIAHLIRLLLAEGVTPAELPFHPDWQLWLWDSSRAKAEIDALSTETGGKAWMS